MRVRPRSPADGVVKPEASRPAAAVTTPAVNVPRTDVFSVTSTPLAARTPVGTGGLRLPRCSTDWPLTVRFGATQVGTLEPYRGTGATAFHDVSGVASHGTTQVLVDDGGEAGQYNKLRVLSAGRPAVELALGSRHKDIEDVTCAADGSFILTTSLSGEDPDQHLTTRVRLDPSGTRIQEEVSTDLRAALLGQLRRSFDAAWFERVQRSPAKAGGLNVEGIAADVKSADDGVMLGLRSPLHAGNALVARVAHPFGGAPTTEVFELNLGGHGVRGMEFIPRLNGFVIIGGPVEKGDGYSLWLWRKGAQPERLVVDGFDQLRRPESVTQAREDGRDMLLILSEQSGPECQAAPFNFIKAEMQTTLQPG